MGVSLFVRLLRKGAKGHNADGLRRMAPQLPTLLANLPPMALAGCPAAPRRKARNAAEGEEEQDEEDEQEDDEGDDDKEATVDRGKTITACILMLPPAGPCRRSFCPDGYGVS